MDTSWLCTIPGADPATVAWHALLMLGLAGFVVVGGAVFLVLAVRAYRRSAPAHTLPGAGGAATLRSWHPTAGRTPPTS